MAHLILTNQEYSRKELRSIEKAISNLDHQVQDLLERRNKIILETFVNQYRDTLPTYKYWLQCPICRTRVLSSTIFLNHRSDVLRYFFEASTTETSVDVDSDTDDIRDYSYVQANERNEFDVLYLFPWMGKEEQEDIEIDSWSESSTEEERNKDILDLIPPLKKIKQEPEDVAEV